MSTMSRQPIMSRYPGSHRRWMSGDGLHRGRSASPSGMNASGMMMPSPSQFSSRRSMRATSPKFENRNHSPSAATLATTLYLQRHLQLMHDHNAMGGRPLTLHHHDDNGSSTKSTFAKNSNGDNAPDAAYRRRLQILRENQESALANLSKPAYTSTSQGGIGGVWKANSVNAETSPSTADAPAYSRTRLRSPTSRHKIMVSKL